MATPWILRSKLAPPALPSQHLARPRLADDHAPATLLLAGPGYGKTLALRALFGEGPGVWYALDELDADSSSFFHYLVAGVQEVVPGFGADLLAVLATESADPKRLWARFFEALAAYNLERFTLALDDFHHLHEHAALCEGLAIQLARLPDGVRVLVASRTRPSWPLARLAARGRLRVLEQAALRYTPEEEAAYLALRGAAADTAGWRARAALMEGWPLGLDLLAALGGDRLPAVHGAAPNDQVMAYVAEELFAVQDEATREFMRRAALLDELTPEACRRVFDAADAAERLEALEARQLVQRVGDARTYRYPGYLREFLRAEAERTLPGLSRAEWHRRAAAYYAEEGRAELALPHRLAAQDWEAAAGDCATVFPAMRHGGRQGQISRWLSAFPRAVREGSALLSTWQGHAHARRGEHADAEAAYARALALYEEAEDGAGAFKILVRQCNLALLRQDTPRFARGLMQAQARQADGADEDRADLHLIRALAADQRGDAALMRECNQAVTAIPIGANAEIAASHVIAHLNLYTDALHRGALEDAKRAVAQAIALAEAWEFRPFHLAASFFACELQLLAGDDDAVRRFLQQLPPHWEELLQWHVHACALAVIGHFHQRQGAWKEAEEALQRAMGIFERAGFVEGTKVPLERLAWLAIQRKQYERAVALLAAHPDGENAYDLALALPRARALHLGGDPRAAIAELTRVAPALEALEARLLQTRAQLFRAASLLKLGAREEAAEQFRAAEASLAACGYGFLRTQDQLLWAELAVLQAPAAPAIAPAPTAEPPDRLDIRCFGHFEARLGGVVLDQWPRRKTKLLLACLAIHPRGLGQAALAEALGMDAQMDKALATLRADVSTLRRALEPTLGKYQPSRYVDYEDERYALRPTALGYSDLAAFDTALAEADALADMSPTEAAPRYEAALGAYRGALLEEGYFARYFESARETYRRQALRALDWLARFRAARGERTVAEATHLRAIAVAPCEEAAYLALMRFYRGVGAAERVRQVYWDCRKALKAQLGIAPSAEFEAAARALGE